MPLKNHVLRTCQTIVLVAALTTRARAQTPGETAAPSTPPLSPQFEPLTRLPADLVGFVAGEWHGEGEFANGKKIEADASFAPDPDNQWLLYRHHDRAPNQYRALGMWGYESASKTLVMVANDNFGGSRLFASDGWQDGKVVFRKAMTISPPAETRSILPALQERFTFERWSDHLEPVPLPEGGLLLVRQRCERPFADGVEEGLHLAGGLEGHEEPGRSLVGLGEGVRHPARTKHAAARPGRLAQERGDRLVETVA